MKDLKILIKEKQILLKKGLTVYLGDIGDNIYLQFKKENVFGVNFSYGSYDGKNKMKIFAMDGQIFNRREVLGYFGDCLKLKNNEKHEAFLMGAAFGNDNRDIILSFLFQKMAEHLNEVDLLIVNEVDGELEARDKIFLLKTLELFATKIPILFATKDIASLKISEIKFDVIDENNAIAEYFTMVEAIQTKQYDKYCENIKKENEKNKRRKSNKKVGTRRSSNKKL